VELAQRRGKLVVLVVFFASTMFATISFAVVMTGRLTAG
jgi:hypothetical protein